MTPTRRRERKHKHCGERGEKRRERKQTIMTEGEESTDRKIYSAVRRAVATPCLVVEEGWIDCQGEM